MDKPTCSAPEGCDQTAHTRDLCKKHYQRILRTGTTELRQRARATCTICGDPVKGRGWCSKHYYRWKRTGDPLTEPMNVSAEVSARLTRKENETGLRECKICSKVKPLAEFGESPVCRNGRYPSCMPCQKTSLQVAHQRRKQRDPEGLRRKNRNGHLQRQYGVTVDEFDAMAAKQRGRCAGCGKKAELVLDHDHETGHVRGLLCSPCNLALGFAEDSIKRLEQLRAYLLAHKGRIF